MPCLSSGLHCTGNRRRAVGIHYNILTHTVGDPVRDGALVPCSTTRVSSHHVTKFQKGDVMQKIPPFLWFDDKAEEAINFYVSIFNNSKVGSLTRSSWMGKNLLH